MNDTLHYAIMNDSEWSDPYWIILSNGTSRELEAQMLLELLDCLMFWVSSAMILIKRPRPTSRIGYPDAQPNIKGSVGSSRREKPQ